MLVLWCVYVGNNNSSATSLFKRWPKIALLQSKDVPFHLQFPSNFPFFSEEPLGRNKKLMRWISGWPRELSSQQVLSSCWNLILESLKLKANFFIHFKSLKLKHRFSINKKNYSNVNLQKNSMKSPQWKLAGILRVPCVIIVTERPHVRKNCL